MNKKDKHEVWESTDPSDFLKELKILHKIEKLSIDNNVIYIAQPFGCKYREINQSDKRRAGKTALINDKNIKFGITDDINRRKKDYKKDVGNVDLTVIVSDEDYSFIEKLEKKILKTVDAYRIKNPSGRKTEWLKDMSFDELKRIIEKEYKELKS